MFLRDVLKTYVGHVPWSYILPYRDVLITFSGDALKTSVGDVLWRYI